MLNDPDVLVLGGGPAGMATAIALTKFGISVAVLERSRYESPRVGEILGPAAKPLLKQLGAWDAVCNDKHLPCPGIVSAWESDELYQTDFYFGAYGCGWALDRQHFDCRLSVVAEEAGVHVCRNMRAIEAVRAPCGWQVTVRFTNHHTRIWPKFLVDATGRSAWLAYRRGARPIACDRLIGVIATILGFRRDVWDRRLLLEATEHGWWYSAHVAHGTMVAAYMTDADYLANARLDLRSFWLQRLQDAHHTRARLRGEDFRFSVRVVLANSYRMSSVGDKDWLAVGDAAMAWDPLSAQGIIKALNGGFSAASTIAAALQGDLIACQRHHDNVVRSFDEYGHARKHFYARVRRWPASKFWQRRQSPN